MAKAGLEPVPTSNTAEIKWKFKELEDIIIPWPL